MLLCYLPILSLSLYSWSTGHHQPPFMWIIFGLSGHSNTVINPILYYLLSQKARKALFTKLYNILGWQCFVTNELCDTTEVPTTDQIAYTAYFDTMITTKAGRKALEREAESHYCPELTKFFFEDHPKWLAMVAGPKKKKSLYCVQEDLADRDQEARSPSTFLELSQNSLYESREGSKLATETEISIPEVLPEVSIPLTTIYEPKTDEQGELINKFANYIHKTYIEEHAPLSLNLSDELRQDVEDRLFRGQSEIVASTDSKPEKIFMEVDNVVKELIQNNLAKAAFNCPEVRKGFEAHLRVLDSSRGPL